MKTYRQLRGRNGEKAAVTLLKSHGYTILNKNFRVGRSEIDIICEKGGLLVFVEVKSRSTEYFGMPESFLSEKQIIKIHQAADCYLDNYLQLPNIRFDIIAVKLSASGQVENIKHLKDAF